MTITPVKFAVEHANGQPPLARAEVPTAGYVYVAVSATVVRSPGNGDAALVRLRNLSTAERVYSALSSNGGELVLGAQVNAGDIVEVTTFDVNDSTFGDAQNPNLAVWLNTAAGFVSNKRISGITSADASIQAQNVTVSPNGSTGLVVTWIDAAGSVDADTNYYGEPHHYDISYRPQGDATWTRVTRAVAQNVETYSISDLLIDTTYEVRLYAEWDTEIYGPPSDLATGKTDAGTVLAPTNTTPPTVTAASAPVYQGETSVSVTDIGGWDNGGGSLTFEWRPLLDGVAQTTWNEWEPGQSYTPTENGDLTVEVRATNSADSTVVTAPQSFDVLDIPGFTIVNDISPASANLEEGGQIVTDITVAGADGYIGILGWSPTGLTADWSAVSVLNRGNPLEGYGEYTFNQNSVLPPAARDGDEYSLFYRFTKDGEPTQWSSPCVVTVGGEAPPAEWAGGSSHTWASGQTDPTLTVPAGASAGDRLIVALSGQAMSVSSIGAGGTELVPVTNHLDTVDGSTRDFELTVWTYILDAGDISAGTIATDAVGIRSAQLAAVSGAASVAASTITGVVANDYATPAVSPSFAGACVLSYAVKHNDPGSADMAKPSNMLLSGTNLMGTDDRQSSLAYVNRTVAGTFTPAIWDGAAAHSMMGVTITVSPAGDASPSTPTTGNGWATPAAYVLVGTTSYSVGSKAELDALAGTLNPGDLVVIDEGITITDSVLFERGFSGDRGNAAAPIIFAAAGISSRPQIRRSSSTTVALRSNPGDDYLEFWGLDIYSAGTTAVLLGGNHSSLRWCRIATASGVQQPASRWLNPAVFSGPAPPITGGEMTDCLVTGGNTGRGEGLYLGWGGSLSGGSIYQRHSGFRSKRNFFEVSGGGAIDVKPGITDFLSEDDVVRSHDGWSGCVNILDGWNYISSERSTDPNVVFDRLRASCDGTTPDAGDAGGPDGDAIRWGGTATLRNSIIFNAIQAGIHFRNPQYSTVTLENVTIFGCPAGAAIGNASPAGWSVNRVRIDSQGSRAIPGAITGLVAGDFVGPTSGDAVAAGEAAAVGAGAGTGFRYVGQDPYVLPA